MNTKTQEALKMIKIYLDGIDKTQSEYDDGWWETSSGAEFGKECLTKVLKVVEALESQESFTEAAAQMSFMGLWDAYTTLKMKLEALESQETMTPKELVKRLESGEEWVPAWDKHVAWMKSALDNARDVCKYLDHDMIKEAKAHTKFFWNDVEKIKETDTHPAQPTKLQNVPLTDDEIDNILESMGDIKDWNYIEFARAIEKAHGIGE